MHLTGNTVFELVQCRDVEKCLQDGPGFLNNRCSRGSEIPRGFLAILGRLSKEKKSEYLYIMEAGFSVNSSSCDDLKNQDRKTVALANWTRHRNPPVDRVKGYASMPTFHLNRGTPSTFRGGS